uniref:Heterokaryon incompatibility domain-containing protein n=1 Tax=Alexandrium catenella TaxID=2925 RepID=A0A7S1MH02_ALECA
MGPAIIGVAILLAIVLSRAITLPLRTVRDSMALLGSMKIEDALRHNNMRRFKVCPFSELRDLRASFETAARCLLHWRTTETARRMKLEEEKSQRVRKTIEQAEQSARHLLHPMVLVWAPDFLLMANFTSYERMRNDGLLMFIDTEEALQSFRQQRTIVFLSHQWLSWGVPDPNGIHFRAMKSAIRQVSEHLQLVDKRGSLQSMYVWVDYCCIAQEHRGMQMLAVTSLPVYAACSDAFVVIAPDASHEKSAQLCDLQSYYSRGWCRAEMLAKVCSSGLDHFFVLASADGSLEEITEARLASLPLDVFEGEFSCCEQGHKDSETCDKESLVVAVLGLYSLVLNHLKSGSSQKHMEPVIAHVVCSKQHFFPPTFTFQSHEGWSEERELFGCLAEALEAHVEGPCIEAASHRHLCPHLAFDVRSGADDLSPRPTVTQTRSSMSVSSCSSFTPCRRLSPRSRASNLLQQ